MSGIDLKITRQSSCWSSWQITSFH